MEIEKLKILLQEYEQKGHKVIYAALTIEDSKGVIEKYEIGIASNNIEESPLESYARQQRARKFPMQ